MKNIPVQYAIPSRQVMVIIGGTCVLVGGIIAMALSLDSPKVAAFLALVGIVLFIWWMVRSVYGDGLASLDEIGLEIVPLRSCFCGGAGLVRIGWDQIDRVEVGATNAPNSPKLFVTLRVRAPRRSWIMVLRRAEDAEFPRRVLELTNAVRGQVGSAPLVAENPYDSPGWKFASILCLISFCGGVVAFLVSGTTGDPYNWVRVLVLGAFAFPLARQVFGSKQE